MIVGLTGFKQFSAQSLTTTTAAIDAIRSAVNNTLPKTGEAPRCTLVYYSSGAPGMSLKFPVGGLNGVGPRLTNGVSEYAFLRQGDLNSIIKEVGDTFIMGCRVGNLSTPQPLAGFFAGPTPNSALATPTIGSGSNFSRYVEVGVSKISEGEYRYIVRSDAVVVFDEVRTTLYWGAGIGVSNAWGVTPIVNATRQIALDDVYCAYNHDGEWEFLGSCHVAAATVSVTPGEYPAIQNSTIASATMTSGSVSPDTLSQDVLLKITNTFAENVNVKAVSFNGYARSSVQGQEAVLKTSIHDEDMQELVSSQVSNADTSRYQGTSPVCVPTTTDGCKNLNFVVSNNKS